jgi:hypothetical protein
MWFILGLMFEPATKIIFHFPFSIFHLSFSFVGFLYRAL